MNALRFALEGEGAVTIVEGKPCPMVRGDLILTPGWTWHEHEHGGHTRSVWVDALDVPIHRHLAAAWKAPSQAADAIRRALVLCADHELSSSAFAVRVTASTGASLRHAVIAGLVTLSGPYHGGMTERVRAYLDNPGAVLLPSSRHRLYPEGDPRAEALLENVPLLASDATTLRTIAGASGGPSHVFSPWGLDGVTRRSSRPRPRPPCGRPRGSRSAAPGPSRSA